MKKQADKSASNNDLNTPKDDKNSKITNSGSREEYFKKLRSWLTTVNSYQCYYNKLQQESLQNNHQRVTKNPSEIIKNVPNVRPETSTAAPDQFVGLQCFIPPLWKRFGAEFIDFILLSLIKFVVIYSAMHSVNDIDFISKFTGIFMQDDFNVDYTTAVEMTSELFFLEVTHRLIVCIYEIYCLQGGTLVEGGATIGKMLLNLTVVRADKLFHIRGQPADVIALTPGINLGLKHAIFRSINKNLFFVFLFPLPFITAAANQNRCVYDVLCGSMVIEVIRPLRCDQSELTPIV